MRKLAELLIAAVLLTSAACGGGGDSGDDPDPTVPTSASSSTTATSAAADPFATPEQIDAAYVDRVLVELNRVYGDVLRKIRATNLYERSDLDPLRAIFNDPLLEVQAKLFAEIPARDAALYRQPIGDRKITVAELITVRPDCIFAKAIFDVGAVAANPPPPHAKYLTLAPTQPGADPSNINPTPFSMVNESDAPQDRCAG